MATPERPVAPPRQPGSTPADARRSQASRVRSAVRTQLAQSQRRRQELSHALWSLRRDLREFRSQVRMRLREMSHEAATRRTPSPKSVAIAAAAHAAAIAALAAPPTPIVTITPPAPADAPAPIRQEPR
jgi:hypothetical protein